MAELELGLSVNEARAGGQAVGFSTLRAIASPKRVSREGRAPARPAEQRCKLLAELELGLSVNEARAGGQAAGFSTLRAIARYATSVVVGRSERSVSAIKLAIPQRFSAAPWWTRFRLCPLYS